MQIETRGGKASLGGSLEEEVEFVAEVSSNHGGDLDRSLAFIDRAAEIGCGAVKFQLFRIRELFAPEVLAASAAHRERERWELPESFLPALAERAHERGLRFSCTPFHLGAVATLEPHVDFYKISSYELPWTDLLAACARTGRPVVLSTGMATRDEVARAVGALARAGCRDLTLLHCVSDYPARAADANLAAIATLREIGAAHAGLLVRAGWSDHTVEPGVIHRAVHRHGASMIEFHLDLDGRGAEFAPGHCWLPEPIEAVIRDVRTAASADGRAGKRLSAAELEERDWRADPEDGLRPQRRVRAGFAA